MRDQVVVITGATSGIGLETARILASLGARLILLCRDQQRAEAVAAELRLPVTGGARSAAVIVADLSLQSEVRRAAALILARPEPLHALINNAGVAPASRRMTSEGLELGLATNVIAPFLLTSLLQEKLAASAPARVVFVAGAYHKKASLDLSDLLGVRQPFKAMAEGNRQKLLLVALSVEFARRFASSGVTFNALHPGIARTGIQRELSWPYQFLMRTLLKPLFGSARGPANNVTRMVTSPQLASTSGAYFHEGRLDRAASLATDPAVGDAIWQWLTALTGDERPRAVTS